MASLIGCDKLFSGQDAFLESMIGRWTTGETQGGVAINKVDGKLVGIDEAGSVFIVTPTGKLDGDNQKLPVKVELYIFRNEIATYLEILRNLVTCKSNCSQMDKLLEAPSFERAQNVMGQLIGIDREPPAEAAYKSIFSSLSYVHLPKLEGLQKLKAELLALNGTIKAPLVFQGVLYNSAENKDSVKFAIANDSGADIWNLGFVRKLNDDEANKLIGYKTNITNMASIADKALNAQLAIVDKNIQSSGLDTQIDDAGQTQASVVEDNVEEQPNSAE